MSLADLVLGSSRIDPTAGRPVTDIITFVQAPWGLNTRLYPVQRVILKAHYGIALDDNEHGLPLDVPIPDDHPLREEYGDRRGYYKHRVVISDWHRQNYQYMTEAGYLRYLYDNGRCNIREVVPGDERRKLVLSIGRRSGKTYISSCIAAYETYKLISKGDPHAYYAVSDSNVIQIISVATDKDQAKLLYREVLGHYSNCDFFGPYMANYTQSFATFQTPVDIERHGTAKDNPKARFSVMATFKSCVAKGLRGSGNIVVILDEVAHFTDGGQSSADEVWQAINPSQAAFSPKDEYGIPVGAVEARSILISSPLGRQGFFFNRFQMGMEGDATMLCIQAPTWEVNPGIPADYFETEYKSDPPAFFTEFGAEFSDRTRGFLEGPELLACIDPKLRGVRRGAPRSPHYLGLDLGLVGDGTAVAIGHVDQLDRIVLDYIDVIQAGVGDFEGVDRLDFDTVADWIAGLSRKFYIAGGMFDQWSGIPLEQALMKRGLKQVRSEHLTKPKNSQIWKNFRDMLYDRRLVLFDHPIEPGEEHCAYIKELLELQEEVQSKYVIKVAAPNAQGKHDDMSDALARMVWMATQNLGNPRVLTGTGPNGRTRLGQESATHAAKKAIMHARRRSLMGGSHPDRQKYRVNGLGKLVRRK